MTAIPVSPKTLRSLSSAWAPAWMTTALVGLILFAAMLGIGPKFLNDPDTQWHIAAGRWMWENGRLPTTDPFSHTFAGAPWIAKEWLSQLILFSVYALAGWTGVVALTAAVVAGCLAFVWGWMTQRLRTTPVLATLALVFAVAAPQLLARPHLLAVPVVMALTVGLVDALDRRRPPSLWLVLPIVLWANLHASFPLGLVVAGVLAGEAVTAAPAAARRTTMLRWALFLAVALAAACTTPYGYKNLLLVFNFFANAPEATEYIEEWRPLAFDAHGLAWAAAFVIVLALLGPDWRRSGFRLLVVLLLGYMSLRHQRFTLLFGVIVPFLVAGPAARRLSGHGPDLAKPPLVAAAVALVALLGVDAALATTIRPSPSPPVTPQAALDYARKAGLEGPAYNDYDFGGALILNGFKSFIDGRSDQLFLGGFTTRLYTAIDAKDDAPFAALLNRYGVRWAVVRTASKDAAHLTSLGWSRPYQDSVATVFVRP